MPTGVAMDLLRVVEDDLRGDRWRAWSMAAVAALLLAPAYYLALLPGLAVHAGAVVAGFGFGLLWGQRRTRAYEAGMRSAWKEWNRYATACESLPDVDRRVRGRSLRMLIVLYAAGLTTLWSVELLLLVLALNQQTAFWWSFVAVAANGLLVGGLLGHFLRRRRWTRDFRASLREMVDRGELGVWGTL